MSDSIYLRDGNTYSPTEWAGSPWSGELQHGGPVNALFATAAQEAAEQTGLRVVRLTVDLFRPVPMLPLVLEWRFARKGHRIAAIEAQLVLPAEAKCISRASAVLLRPSPELPPAWSHTPGPVLEIERAEPIEFIPKLRIGMLPPGFHRSFEVRMGDDERGPAAWITTPLQLIPDEPMSPLQRCAAVADLTFGLSRRLREPKQTVDANTWPVAMINTDTTIYWERQPVGNWFGFRNMLLTANEGTGLAEIDLTDSQGHLGRSLQALLANA